MYQCIDNTLYLLFLRNSLKGIICLNKPLQSDSAELLKLLQDLDNLPYSTLQRIAIPKQLKKACKQDLCNFQFKDHLIPPECISFGFYFNQLGVNCSPENLLTIKERCKDFRKKFTEKLQLRIPTNMKIL